MLSQTYYYLCLMLFVEKKIGTDTDLEEIDCPTKGFAACLKQYLKSIGREIRVFGTGNGPFISFLKQCKHSFQYFANFLSVKKRNACQDNWTGDLIFTYIYSHQLKGQETLVLKDFKKIESLTNRKLTIVPYIILNDSKNLKQTVDELGKIQNINIALRENHLRIRDCLKVFSLSRKFRKLNIDNLRWGSVEVDDLIRESFQSDTRSVNVMDGLMNYCLMRNLKKEGRKIGHLIEWYEGQPSSNGLFFGYHKFYRGKNSVGYTGLPVTRNMMGVSPAIEQAKYGGCPDTISVIGEGYKELIQQFNPDFRVICVPSFRMDSIWKIHREGVAETGGLKSEELLLVLPSGRSMCRKMLNAVFASLDSFTEKKKYSIIIKNHPDNLKLTVDDYGVDSRNFSVGYVEGDLLKTASGKAGVIVSAEGSTLLELLVRGVNVIVFDQYTNLYGDILETYHIDMPHVYDMAGMKKAIQQLGESNQNYYGDVLLKSLAPINEETTGRLFA